MEDFFASSAVGYSVLLLGLIGDLYVIWKYTKGKLEKGLGILFTLLVIFGVAVEHKAEVRIEQKLLPRHLSEEQQERIIKKLAVHAGQQLNIFNAPDSKEIGDISNEIFEILKSDQWSLLKATGRARYYANNQPARTTEGILIEYSTEASETDISAGKDLADALRAENLVVEGPTMVSADSPAGLFLQGAKLKITIDTK